MQVVSVDSKVGCMRCVLCFGSVLVPYKREDKHNAAKCFDCKLQLASYNSDIHLHSAIKNVEA